MAGQPLDFHDLGVALFEQWVSFIIDGFSFFSADQEGGHLLTHNSFGIRESFLIQQAHESHKRLGLAGMRSCSQE